MFTTFNFPLTGICLGAHWCFVLPFIWHKSPSQTRCLWHNCTMFHRAGATTHWAMATSTWRKLRGGWGKKQDIRCCSVGSDFFRCTGSKLLGWTHIVFHGSCFGHWFFCHVVFLCHCGELWCLLWDLHTLVWMSKHLHCHFVSRVFYLLH